MPNREIADVIGDHAIQPPRAVAPSQRNSGFKAEVVNSATAQQSRKLIMRVGKERSRCGSAVFTLASRLIFRL
jgi:hypothetical protein